MTAPRAMTVEVIGLLLRSQGEAAFLRRQRTQARSGNVAEGGGGQGTGLEGNSGTRRRVQESGGGLEVGRRPRGRRPIQRSS